MNFSTDCFAIAYRADLDQLTGRWLRSIAEDELASGYEALRRAALHHACPYWLIDSRRRTNRSRNGPEWVTTHYLPQVQQELGSRLCVCFLVLPAYLSTLPTSLPAPAPGHPVQFARFLDEGAANAWLAQQQASAKSW